MWYVLETLWSIFRSQGAFCETLVKRQSMLKELLRKFMSIYSAMNFLTADRSCGPVRIISSLASFLLSSQKRVSIYCSMTLMLTDSLATAKSFFESTCCIAYSSIYSSNAEVSTTSVTFLALNLHNSRIFYSNSLCFDSSAFIYQSLCSSLSSTCSI